MSTYEHYDTTSQAYDDTRTAVGIEIVLGYLASLPAPLPSLRVLDAGCGTGNYTLPLARQGCHVVCVDHSPGMLQRCRQKLEAAGAEHCELVQGDLAELSFGTARFDAVMCNQSLHHLDQPGTGFPKLRRFLRTAAKALKPDGLLLINTITHQQLHDGVWWGELIAPAVERMKPRFAEFDVLQDMLVELGMTITDRVVPLDSIIQQKGYFDPDSLRLPEFRSGDSHFSLLTPEELDQVFTRLDDMEAAGTLGAYIEKRDQLRRRIGQYMYYIARKTLVPAGGAASLQLESRALAAA